MAWPPVLADLYRAAPESYFDGVSDGDQEEAIAAAYGELATALSPRCGGDPAEWTWTHTAGQAVATRDVATVAAYNLTLSHGLTLPGEGADPVFVRRGEAVMAKWRRMGTVGETDRSKVEPLYSGLVDSTPLVTEGAALGWYTPHEEQAGGVEA
jgi:hypothetical protein